MSSDAAAVRFGRNTVLVISELTSVERDQRRYPPQPILLDTCAVQGLREATAFFHDNGAWDDAGPEELLAYYGRRKGSELIALGNVVQRLRYNGAPWLVSRTSLLEFQAARPDIARGLLSWWIEWADYMEASSTNYPEIDLDLLFDYSAVVHPDQMQLPFVVAVASPLVEPAFPPFKDTGDCALMRDALRARVPAILTLDLRSFWRHRRTLWGLGLEVWRPLDYWEAIRPQPSAAS